MKKPGLGWARFFAFMPSSTPFASWRRYRPAQSKIFYTRIDRLKMRN